MGSFLGALQWFQERRHADGEVRKLASKQAKVGRRSLLADVLTCLLPDGEVRGGEAGVLAELNEEMMAELADGSHGDLGFRRPSCM